MGTDKTAFAGKLPEVTWPENTEVCSAHAQPEVRNIHPSGVFWPEVYSVHARLFSYYSSKCNTVIQVPWLPEVTEGHVTPLGFPRVCACATCTISTPIVGPFVRKWRVFFSYFFFFSSHFFHLFPFFFYMSITISDMYMLSGCELIDTENISLPSQNMKFGGEWAKRTSHKLHILSSRLISFSINHIHIQMTCLSFLNQT